MAIQIKNTYSGRTDNTDPNYPYGKGRNVVGGVEGTGTPFEADWYNNLEGFLQGLLLEAGVTPDGDVDNANSSQLVEAVKGIIWGERFKGTFKQGFTYTSSDDVGLGQDGLFYKYVGEDEYPVVVAAGTVPSAPDYEQVTFNSASDVTDSRGTNVQDYIDGNLTPFKTVADMKVSAYLSSLPEFTRVEWQGYHAQSDGGSNWGVLRFGTHTDDGGSIFSIDANTYIEANLAGEVSLAKFGVRGFDSGDDALGACQKILSLGLPLSLVEIYGLSDSLILPAGSLVKGSGRDKSGFKALSTFNVSSNRALVSWESPDVTISDFQVDANNLPLSGSTRLNCVSQGHGATNFSISRVDVYNCTGYGHVAFDNPDNQNTSGTLLDCFSRNCQVSFEQTGAKDITLIKCVAEGVPGRTLETFHPYNGAKNINYIACKSYGGGSKIKLVTIAAKPLGPIGFHECDVETTGAGVCVSVGNDPYGDAPVYLNISGGSYKSVEGVAVNFQSSGIYKIIGGAYESRSGFACPAEPFDSTVDLIGVDIKSVKNTESGVSYGLITGGSDVSVVGGSITAENSLGASVAVLGVANISEQTRLLPDSGSGATVRGVSALVPAGTGGYVNIDLPRNANSEDELDVQISLITPTSSYVDASISWFYVSVTKIRVWVNGVTDPAFKIAYKVTVVN